LFWWSFETKFITLSVTRLDHWPVFWNVYDNCIGHSTWLLVILLTANDNWIYVMWLLILDTGHFCVCNWPLVNNWLSCHLIMTWQLVIFVHKWPLILMSFDFTTWPLVISDWNDLTIGHFLLQMVTVKNDCHGIDHSFWPLVIFWLPKWPLIVMSFDYSNRALSIFCLQLTADKNLLSGHLNHTSWPLVIFCLQMTTISYVIFDYSTWPLTICW
jgi:hypothetical protein